MASQLPVFFANLRALCVFAVNIALVCATTALTPLAMRRAAPMTASAAPDALVRSASDSRLMGVAAVGCVPHSARTTAQSPPLGVGDRGTPRLPCHLRARSPLAAPMPILPADMGGRERPRRGTVCGLRCPLGSFPDHSASLLR